MATRIGVRCKNKILDYFPFYIFPVFWWMGEWKSKTEDKGADIHTYTHAHTQKSYSIIILDNRVGNAFVCVSTTLACVKIIMLARIKIPT